MESVKGNFEIVLVTGYSGAGLSTAIHALEDLGFYCIDNLPLELAEKAIQNVYSKNPDAYRGIAFSVHFKDLETIDGFLAIRDKLKTAYSLKALFLYADHQALLSRYGSSRRKHPFGDPSTRLSEAIKEQMEKLHAIETSSDCVIDTSHTNPHQLARLVEAEFEDAQNTARTLSVNITSFGFKYGTARRMDNLFDVRFLRNPYFELNLRDKTGLNREIQDYVMNSKESGEYFERISTLMKWLLPRYYREGKNYLRIGVGCTGGKHRSVTIAERLLKELSSEKYDENIIFSIFHRDIDRH